MSMNSQEPLCAYANPILIIMPPLIEKLLCARTLRVLHKLSNIIVH